MNFAQSVRIILDPIKMKQNHKSNKCKDNFNWKISI